MRLQNWLLLVVLLAFTASVTAEDSPVGVDVQPISEAVEVAEEAVAEVVENVDPAEAEAEEPAVEEPVKVELPNYGDPIILENEHGIVEITTEQAAIRRFRLNGTKPIFLPDHYLKPEEKGVSLEENLAVMGKHHPVGPLHNWLANLGLGTAGENGSRGARWEIVEQSKTSVTLEHVNGETPVRYAMRYTLRPDRATVDVALLVKNEGDEAVAYNPVVYPVNGVHQDVGSNESYYLTVAEHRGGENGDLVRRDGFPGPRASTDVSEVDASFDYLALKSRFFAAIWEPTGLDVGSDVSFASAVQAEAAPAQAEAAPAVGGGPGGGPAGGSTSTPTAIVAGGGKSHILRVQATGYEQDPAGPNTKRQAFIVARYSGANGNPIAIPAGESLRISWAITVTSMRSEDLETLTVAEQRLEYTDGFHRFFRVLSDILAWMLLALASIPGVGYGLGVILLTILIKAALHRTTFKQQKSMLGMQKLGPELKRIQEQYKSDPQARNAKTMELWKKHGVNPLGGCLPIFIQMPIFIALYQAFSHVAELRGESFLWIDDLTLPDQIVYLFSIGSFNVTLNILPILYIIISLFMTFSNKPPENNGGNEQAAQMMKMMRWMPVMFGFIFYNMPSGLVLYFTMSALISTLELKYIRKKLGGTGTPVM